MYGTGQYKAIKTEVGRIWRRVSEGQVCVGGKDGHPSIAV